MSKYIQNVTLDDTSTNKVKKATLPILLDIKSE